MTARDTCMLGGLLAILAVGCGSPRDVAGSSSETGNVLTARILPVDSILEDWNRPFANPTVATLRLEASNFPFANSRPTAAALAVERLDGTPIPYRVVHWEPSLALGRLEVRLDPALQARGSKIRLRWDLPDSARADSASVWRSIPDSSRLAWTSVLVDDFERGTLRSTLPLSAMWFTQSGDSAIISPPELVAAGRGRMGNALHFTYMAEKGYAFGGVPLADGSPRSLRSLDSIVVWVRGPAKLAVGFDHRDVGKAWRHQQLDSNWTRLSLRPRDMEPANGAGGNVGWNGVRDSVTHLVFFVSQGSDLWVDDVVLHGVNRDDLD
jgi:hypothetical protein